MAFGDGLTRKVPCKVCAYIDSLDPQERARVTTFFAEDSGYAHTALARELVANGVQVGEKTVRRHRMDH